MSRTGIEFPPHLLSLEFLTPGSLARLLEQLDRVDSEVTVPLWLAADSSLLRELLLAVIGKQHIRAIGPTIRDEQAVQTISETLPEGVVCLAQFSRHRLAEELAMKSRRPLLNLGTDWAAPCQVLADYYTIKQKIGQVEKLCYAGRPGPYLYSLMRLSLALDFKLALRILPGCPVDPLLLRSVRERGGEVFPLSLSHPLRTGDILCLGRGARRIPGFTRRLEEAGENLGLLLPPLEGGDGRAAPELVVEQRHQNLIKLLQISIQLLARQKFRDEQ